MNNALIENTYHQKQADDRLFESLQNEQQVSRAQNNLREVERVEVRRHHDTQDGTGCVQEEVDRMRMEQPVLE